MATLEQVIAVLERIEQKLGKAGGQMARGPGTKPSTLGGGKGYDPSKDVGTVAEKFGLSSITNALANVKETFEATSRLLGGGGKSGGGGGGLTGMVKSMANMFKVGPQDIGNVSKLFQGTAQTTGEFGTPSKVTSFMEGIMGVPEGASVFNPAAAAGAGEAAGVAGEAAAGMEAAGAGAASAGEALAGLGAAGGPIGLAIAAAVALAAALVALPFLITSWAKSLRDSNVALGQFSGSMAQVAAQKEVFEILQGVRQGEARAESTGKLEEALEHLSESLEPITNALSNFFSSALAAFVELIALVIDIVNFLFGDLFQLIELMAKGINLIIDILKAIAKALTLGLWKMKDSDEKIEENWQQFWDNTNRQKFMTNRQPVPRIL